VKILTISAEQRRLLVYFILFFSFIQLITEFVAGIYAFGLLGTGIPAEIISILLFFSPILLLVFGRGFAARLPLFAGILVLLCRAIEVFLDTRGRMLVSGLGVAAFLLLLPALIWELGKHKDRNGGIQLGSGLAIGLSLAILDRALNSGTDLTAGGWARFVGVILALLAGAMLPGMLQEIQTAREVPQPNIRVSFVRIAGHCLGIGAAWILLYFTFASPNVIARWSEVNYLSVLATIALGTICFVLIIVTKGGLQWITDRRIVIAWNSLFILAMLLAILPHQLRFPVDAAGYPLYEPASNPAAYLTLYLMLFLYPVILVDFMLYTQALVDLQPPARSLGGGFLLGSFFILLLVLSHVFTTVYDYIPVVGPFFRDKFWLVYLVAGIMLFLPLLFKRREMRLPVAINSSLRYTLASASLLTVLAAALISAKPSPASTDVNSLRVLTYNIQQGYSESGERNFDGQLDLIRSLDADIIGLQESDTNRIAGGNNDVVRYFSDRLGMYSYYGPKTVTGTFGIALLSKYPIMQPQTFFMFSEGEQTATIHAQVIVGSKTNNLFITHLGNGGPIVQQEAFLEEVDNLENVIAMGDFNFEPDTEQYHLTRSLLEDAWLIKWPDGIDDQGYNPVERIDHVFVTPGTRVSEARFLTGPESDHPALFVEITW